MVLLQADLPGLAGRACTLELVDLRVNDDITIPERELTWRFETSGGPGGQHANKSATRAVLEFDVEASHALPDEAKERVLANHPRRFVVAVDDTRSQWRNREIARERLAQKLDKALAPPPRPRRTTKPGRAAKAKRLSDKRKRGEKKRQRQRPDWDSG